MTPRLLPVREAATYCGFRSKVKFYEWLKIDPTFPHPIILELGVYPPDHARAGEKRFARPVYDVHELDAWIDAQKEPERRARAEADRLLSLAAGANVAAPRARRRGRGASSGHASGGSSAA